MFYNKPAALSRLSSSLSEILSLSPLSKMESKKTDSATILTQEITNALRTEMPFGETYSKAQMLNGYSNVYSNSVWMDVVKALLGY